MKFVFSDFFEIIFSEIAKTDIDFMLMNFNASKTNNDGFTIFREN